MSKPKFKPQTRTAGEIRFESINEEERSAEFCISSESPDTYDTVFYSSGWELERYHKNPVVTFQHRDHDPNPDLVIGTSEVRIENNELIGKVFFESAEDNPLAEKVFRKVKNKILRGASVWASIKEGRYGVEKDGEDPEMLYFTRQELRAWSIVTVMSNPDAVARNEKSLGDFKKEIEPVADPGDTSNKAMSRYAAQLSINQNLS